MQCDVKDIAFRCHLVCDRNAGNFVRWTLDGLVSNSLYQFRSRAVTSYSEGSWSGWGEVRTGWWPEGGARPTSVLLVDIQLERGFVQLLLWELEGCDELVVVYDFQEASTS